MTYQLGIDLGTTYTAAAVWRSGQRGRGRAEMITLGAGTATVASVLYLGEDGTVLVGESAERRALTDPDRVVREFKRRIGDETPIIVGGRPYQAQDLAAQMVRWVVNLVAQREGGPAAQVAITHPASWGPHKKDLLGRALQANGLNVTFLAEPEAAALSYARSERIEPGSTIAVYDLGGGTFDAAIVRKNGTFTLLGQPEGIERLGGIDFDDVVFGHVRSAVGRPFDRLNPADPNVLAAVARLRRDCVEGKEALSADTEVTIPVLLPELRTQIRLVRADFEGMIRPALEETVEALRRAIASADLTPADLTAVLLVGGSSRIPLVAQLVSNELGRPVAVDADPKNAIALGAVLSISPEAGMEAAGEPAARQAPATGPDDATPPSGIPRVPVAPPSGLQGPPGPPAGWAPGPGGQYAAPPPGGQYAAAPPPGGQYAAAPPPGGQYAAGPPPAPGGQYAAAPPQPNGGQYAAGPPPNGGQYGPGQYNPGQPPAAPPRPPMPEAPQQEKAPKSGRRRGPTIVIAVVLVVAIGVAAFLFLRPKASSSTASATLKVTSKIAVGGGPDGVTISPDGAHLYVTDSRLGKLSVIDTASGALAAEVKVTNPIGMAINPDGSRLFVMSKAANTVSVIDTANNAVGATIAVGKGPVQGTFNRDGSRAYVSNIDAGTVSVIDATTNKVVATPRVSDRPNNLKLTPDGSRIYITNTESDQVSVLDTASNQMISNFALTGKPFTTAFSPDGKQAYITQFNAKTLAVVDTGNNRVTKSITVGKSPVRAVTSLDGHQVYVTNAGDNNLSVINADNQTVTSTLPLDQFPSDAVLSPDGKRLYVANTNSGSISVIQIG